MTDSQIHRYCVDDMDKYIAGVSLYSKQMKQKVYQLSVELENERECANSIENLFVLLAGSLIVSQIHVDCVTNSRVVNPMGLGFILAKI